MMKRFLTLSSIKLIDAYKYIISPFLGNNCRYLPTCSEYTKDSIIKFGLKKGIWLGFKCWMHGNCRSGNFQMLSFPK